MLRGVFAFLLISLSACSLYQSQGRKLLEQQAFELASGLTANNFDYCGSAEEQPPASWTIWMVDERAEVHVSSDGRMRVTDLKSGGTCFYSRFNSIDEMREKTDAAIVVSLHLSPASCVGKFAFQSSCNLK